MIFEQYADRDMMMISLANRIASELGGALRSKGKATLCVPGGTTPGPIFDLLSAVDLDWANVAVLLNDERWVPQDHPRSNTRLVQERLLKGKAAAAIYIPLYQDVDAPEQALDKLAEGITPQLPITVLLLGMGADRHTASLFPGADFLEQALSDAAPPVMALRAANAGEPRITLTAPVLKSAMHTHILITGPEKRAALETASGLPVAEAPVNLVLPDATVHWAE